MQLCFVDEAGDLGALRDPPGSNDQPVLVVAGLFVDAARLADLPTFGHSDNHVGLQVCDIVCSALLYPIACHAYCTGHVNNVHVQPGASRLRRRYGAQLKEFQHRYYDAGKSRYVGGVVVSDYLQQRSGALMFGD